jgi:hypothetical protein
VIVVTAAADLIDSWNRGSWKKLEEYTRKYVEKYDSGFVWCGSVILENRYIGRGAGQDCCWKIIYIKRLGIVKAYSMRNEMSFQREMHSLRYL